MAELNKGALTSENNNSFPNNNTGYITPTLLRTFNQNMIDSMVDEISYNADSASVSASISQLKNFSSSLDNTYATDAQLSASASTLQNNINSLSASVAVTDLAQSSSIAALQVFSSSLDATFATDAQLSASASTLQDNINLKVNTSSTSSMTVLSSSYAVTSSFSLTSSFAQNAGNVDTGSLVSTASFNAYTASATVTSASFNQRINALDPSGSAEAIASLNAFTASQYVSNSLFLQSNVTASFVTTSSFNTYTSSASTNVSGAINAATSSLSASLTLTDNSKLNTGSFNTYTQSIATQIQGLGQTLAGKLNTSSLSVTQNITGSVIISGSSTGAGGETLRLLGGPNPSTDLALHVLSGSVEITTPQGNGAHFYSNAPITSSNLRINGTAVIKDLFVSGTWGGTGSGSLFVENSITASVISASTIIANSASFQYVQTVFETASIIYSSGSNQFGDELSDVQTLSGSVKVQGGLTVNGTNVLLVGQTASYASASISSSYALTASFAENVGDNYATTGSNTFVGNQIISGNLNVSGNITLVQGFDLVTHHVQAAGANGVEIQNNSGNTAILVGAGGSVGSTFYGQINATSISASGNIIAANLATTGSNTFIGNQIISGNLLVTGSNINLEVDPPALSVGVTNVKTLLDATASGVVTSEDIYRTGAGPTGDLSGIRLQTLSGSDTTGDTLLSRISTGVNRHTSTAMTGSVVNTIINSTWATGSAGTRVSYASNVIVNAQSASSTLTLNAGNASANYGGGTASLLAGRVNIGTTNATITSTGSFNHLGALVTSQGITSNNGGITATSGSINGEFRVNGSINITGSNPTIQSGSLSGSLISNLGDIYTGSNNANFIVTLGSASMAHLLTNNLTQPNTLYFVI